VSALNHAYSAWETKVLPSKNGIQEGRSQAQENDDGSKVCCTEASDGTSRHDGSRAERQVGCFPQEKIMAKPKDPRLSRAGVSGYNKPKRTPNHPKKTHVVVAKEGDNIKTIRFGEKGATPKPPRAGESAADKAKRQSFKARHAKGIAKGKMSGSYWADKVRW